MHHHGHCCFASRRKAVDVELGNALPDLPGTRLSSAETLVSNCPRFSSAQTLGNESTTPSTQGNPSGPQPHREARRFRGKNDLQPLRLANIKRNIAKRDIRSARVVRQNVRGEAKETDIGTVSIFQSV